MRDKCVTCMQVCFRNQYILPPPPSVLLGTSFSLLSSVSLSLVFSSCEISACSSLAGLLPYVVKCWELISCYCYRWSCFENRNSCYYLLSAVVTVYQVDPASSPTAQPPSPLSPSPKQTSSVRKREKNERKMERSHAHETNHYHHDDITSQLSEKSSQPNNRRRRTTLLVTVIALHTLLWPSLFICISSGYLFASKTVDASLLIPEILIVSTVSDLFLSLFPSSPLPLFPTSSPSTCLSSLLNFHNADCSVRPVPHFSTFCCIRARHGCLCTLCPAGLIALSQLSELSVTRSLYLLLWVG